MLPNEQRNLQKEKVKLKIIRKKQKKKKKAKKSYEHNGRRETEEENLEKSDLFEEESPRKEA